MTRLLSPGATRALFPGLANNRGFVCYACTVKFRFRKPLNQKEETSLPHSKVNVSKDIQTVSDNFVNCSWPGIYYDKVGSLIALTRPTLVLEVGVAYGYHARHILTSSDSSLHYVGIDPYFAGYDKSDFFVRDVASLFQTSEQDAMDRLFSAVSTSLEDEFPGRSRVIREPSSQACKHFSDLSLDFIFIDGDHRYESVLEDLTVWWPKLVPGGLLVGDDYRWPGVKRAAVDFFSRAGVRHFVLENSADDHSSFFAVKPPN